MRSIFIPKYRYSVFKYNQTYKPNLNNLGFIRPDKTIYFQNSEAAKTYAKNRCIAALNYKEPFERGCAVKNNVILCEINGEKRSVDFTPYIEILPGTDIYHGHPNIYSNGSTPLSLDDYILMLSCNLNKIVAFNKYGEHSTLTNQKRKHIILKLLPKKLQNKLKIYNRLVNGNIATQQYATNYSKLFSKQYQDKIRHSVHAQVGLPYCNYYEMTEYRKNPYTKKELDSISKLSDEITENGTFSKFMHNFWLKTSKKLHCKYSTNFSNLK